MILLRQLRLGISQLGMKGSVGVGVSVGKAGREGCDVATWNVRYTRRAMLADRRLERSLRLEAVAGRCRYWRKVITLVVLVGKGCRYGVIIRVLA